MKLRMEAAQRQQTQPSHLIIICHYHVVKEQLQEKSESTVGVAKCDHFGTELN